MYLNYMGNDPLCQITYNLIQPKFLLERISIWY